jgi:stage V sporulation protein AE
MDKRKVILVTDGDRIAKGAVEVAAANIGGRCISASAGNPTELEGREIIELIKSAHHDPVVVMVDDMGPRVREKAKKLWKQSLWIKALTCSE